LYDGKAEEAAAQFDKLLAEFPAGSWAQKARFR
jgi:hypothetical protein